MAGDWIKMTHALATAPEVVRIASALKADRLRTIGALYVLWCIADLHAEDDGTLPSYTLETLDSVIGWDGFSQAVADAGWLCTSAKCLQIPHFERHNGRTAKRRALDAARKRRVRTPSASKADKKRTRGEGEREKSSNPNQRARETDWTTVVSAFQRWKGADLTSSEEAALIQYSRVLGEKPIELDGGPVSADALLLHAIESAVESQAGYRTIRPAMKYLKAICERCLRESCWPGDFDDEAQGDNSGRSGGDRGKAKDARRQHRADKAAREYPEEEAPLPRL